MNVGHVVDEEHETALGQAARLPPHHSHGQRLPAGWSSLWGKPASSFLVGHWGPRRSHIGRLSEAE